MDKEKPKKKNPAPMIITTVVTAGFVWLCAVAWQRHLEKDMHIGEQGYSDGERQIAAFVAEHLHTRAETHAYWKDQERKSKGRGKAHRQNVLDPNYREELREVFNATEEK